MKERAMADEHADGCREEEPQNRTVILADGTITDLNQLTREERYALQWEQVQAFRRKILDAPKGSPERLRAYEHAYETVKPMAVMYMEDFGLPPHFGFREYMLKLVRMLLRKQEKRGLKPSFLEIGCGSGDLLHSVAESGYPVTGIELSQELWEIASRRMASYAQASVDRGYFLSHKYSPVEEAFSMIWWNDVFEHIPPDEIADHLLKIHSLLTSQGCLVTITPNWHLRPSDATRVMMPPRTEPMGLHLKEYTLREVSALLRDAGFGKITMPLVRTRRFVVLAGGGFYGIKRRLEPMLEWIPAWLARYPCQALAFSCTIAEKGDG